MGPFLWNAQYDGLLRLKLPVGVSIEAFADDALVIVVAENPVELETNANEALETVSRWMKSRGLTLAEQKTEAVLITRRRKFEPPSLELNNFEIPLRDCIKYLGVWIDKRWSFRTHAIEAAKKADRVGAALQRLMPNIGGPRPDRRALLSSVVHSILLYGAPTWGLLMKDNAINGVMGPVQRRMALRVISGYRTISQQAACVLAGMPPMHLLAKERAEIWAAQEEISQQRGDVTTAEKEELRKRARDRLLTEWQLDWDRSDKGRWTHELIPSVKKWVERKHGAPDYYLSQALSGHGCFGSYLLKFKHRRNAKCQNCGFARDDAKHSLFECPTYQPIRNQLEAEMRIVLTPRNIVNEMMIDERRWNKIASYCRTVINGKREKEREVIELQEEEEEEEEV